MIITPLNIILLCWLILIIYWATHWRKVKRTQKREWGFWYLRIIMIILTIGFIVIARKAGVLPSCHVGWYDCYYSVFTAKFGSPAIAYAGVLIAVLGLSVAVAARRALGENWSSTIDLKKDHELITRGVYGYVRHPIYAGFLLMGLGTVLVTQNFMVLAFFISLLVIFLFRINSEEKLMTQTFPKEYPLYKKKVKALIPFVW
jgi:protein-S-isoprenylcysteine O-methyltransferase Ste14